MTDVVIVLTTVPDEDLGEQIARACVDERLAACVTIGAPMTSVYRWNGAVTRERELPLTIKTTAARVAALKERLHAWHSYDVPEFVVLPVVEGSLEYLDWVRQQTT